MFKIGDKFSGIYEVVGTMQFDTSNHGTAQRVSCVSIFGKPLNFLVDVDGRIFDVRPEQKYSFEGNYTCVDGLLYYRPSVFEDFVNSMEIA